MRPLILTLLCVVVSVGTANAQGEDVLRPKNRPARLNTSLRSGGQSPFTIGIEAGLNMTFSGQTINGAISTSPIQTFGSTNGIGPFASFFVDMAITDRVGIQAKIAYDKKSHGTTKSALIDCVTLDAYGNEVSVETSETSNKLSSSITYLTVSPLVRIEPVSRFIVLFGPTIQFRSSSEITELTQTIVDQESDCFFNFLTASQSKTRTSNDTANADSLFNNVRIGIDVSVAYRFPVSSSIDIVPRIGYQMMFTSPTPDSPPFVDNSRERTDGSRTVTTTNRFLNSLQAVVGLWIRL